MKEYVIRPFTRWEDMESLDICERMWTPDVDISARAAKLGNDKVANMVMLGEVVRGTGVVQPETIFKVFEEKFTGKKAALIPLNKQAFLGE